MTDRARSPPILRPVGHLCLTCGGEAPLLAGVVIDSKCADCAGLSKLRSPLLSQKRVTHINPLIAPKLKTLQASTLKIAAGIAA